MPSHLKLLKEMFPGKIYLTVGDVAKLKNLSKGHIYNLCSAAKKAGKELPFSLVLDKVSGRPRVSILAMAIYMDADFNDAPAEKDKETAESNQNPTPIHQSLNTRKRGRPIKQR